MCYLSDDHDRVTVKNTGFVLRNRSLSRLFQAIFRALQDSGGTWESGWEKHSEKNPFDEVSALRNTRSVR